MAQSVVEQAPRLTGVRPLHVGVVGATGNVGRAMLQVLLERGLPVASLRAFASSRSAGSVVTMGETAAVVEDLEGADPQGLDVALFSAGGQRALEHAPRFVSAGVVVVDNSSAFRMHEDVPLVVPEANGHRAAGHTGIVANPNCSTIQMVVALKPLLDAAGLERVQVTTFQAVSGTGRDAMSELRAQSRALVDDRPAPGPSVYAHQIAFNVLPHCDTFDEDGNTREETKLVRETRKILELPDLPVSATCVRVPVLNAHSEAVHLVTRDHLSPERVRDLLRSAPGVQVIDDPATNSYPMPILADGRDDVLVGRIRRDPTHPNGIAMFICADNLRKGAATNAVQIVEQLAAGGQWPA